MDQNECQTVIAAAREAPGRTLAERLDSMDAAGDQFKANALAQFGRRGEW
jgi:hypothetical protein